jgi:hypothetical protein
MVTWKKTTTDGREVRVVINASGLMDVAIDGLSAGRCGHPVRVRTQRGLVWALQTRPPIALTDAERDDLERAIAAAVAAAPVDLDEQRRRLVANLRAALDEWRAEADRAMDLDVFSIPGSPAVEAAARALEEFDAAHPDVAARARAAAAARREENIRAADNA